MNEKLDIESNQIPLETKEYSTLEKLLLPIAILIGILFDQLMFSPVFLGSGNISIFSGIFWLCYLVMFYLFYWKRLVCNRVLWYVAGCSALLCIWQFIFTDNSINQEFRNLTYLVIPAVLMAHAQFIHGNYQLKDTRKIVIGWIRGWFIKPFSGISSLLGVVDSLVSGGNKSNIKKAILGIVITLPLLCVIIPLLSGADQVFGYYFKQIIGKFYFGSLIMHIIVIVFALALFYSFIWNVGFGIKEKSEQRPILQIDSLICYIVIGSVMLLYILFCIVQFTYLFAGTGLPNAMTYSEYAREGFVQTVTVCAINLFLYGIFFQYGSKNKIISGLLAGLLGLTGVMLFSGFIRLKLYIDAYGLTWLRVISAWFVIYLAIVIIICGIRMLREELPAIALCALILLGWYVILGYLNPDALIQRYNQNYNYDIEISVE